MRRETENTLLLIVGIALVMVTITGAYTRYVKPAMLPWLAISAAVVIALALAAIVRDVRSGGAGHDHVGHVHRNGIVWLLVLPVVLLIFVVPPALSARAAAPAAVTVTGALSFPPLPAGPAPAVSLPEVLMRVAVGKVGGLDGRPITTTGFIMRDGDRVDLAKIVIICCAADAQLARLHLSGPAVADAAALPENTWLRVEGTVPAGQTYSGTSSIPTLEVSALTRIDPPANTYG
ncbi:putative repeat protein (TIGR03943 family) [Mycolicibacterium sp. BK634]|uniref:TIGR03943 family putative permease subunit n=1 Tax=Mycobacteriaceae TaxID=1762 RepID=UPI001060E576|nr:TIGR03943 family protein [Mycobacterium sp. BK086]MBB3747952.1 putative repeat protein (TIGR03943 family) [Mycolicibacterium sp. BK634]TDO07913.1 putative repeat protein (TIGR03943 family) [Mycobacterium sp. BK086]